MASKRLFKKEIGYITGELFLEATLLKLSMQKVDDEALDKLMTRILDMQDEYLARANNPDGKDDVKLVKQYYKKLREDLQQEIDAIIEELEASRKGKK